MPIQHARLGWKPDLPDHRDRLFSSLRLSKEEVLPRSVDLRSQCPLVYDQLTTSGCTGNAGAGLGQFLMKKLGQPNYVPSRLFIYWNARQLIGEADRDDGATLRDTMKVLVNQGLPHESMWWYNPAKVTVKPNQSVYQDGMKRRIAQYLRLDNSVLDELRRCLAQGFPFIFGFTVYESFISDEVARTGAVLLPRGSEAVVGGHAVMAVGYDHSRRLFIMRNSWGTGWGMEGYFTMPYDYVTNTNLSDDFWTARSFSV